MTRYWDIKTYVNTDNNRIQYREKKVSRYIKRTGVVDHIDGMVPYENIAVLH